MKRHRRMRLVVVGSVALLGVGAVLLMGTLAQKQPTTPLISQSRYRPQIEVEFQVPLENLEKQFPSVMMVFRTSYDEDATRQLEALSGVLGGSVYLERSQESGGIFAADMERLWAKMPEPGERVNVLSTERLRVAAEGFLAQIGGSLKLETTVNITTDEVEFVDEAGRTERAVIGHNVTYRRLPRDYEGVGPGGKVKIFFDLNGEPSGYLRVWRELSPLYEQPVIPVSQAAEQFSDDPLGRVLLADVEKVVVTDLRLAYYEQGISSYQEYLQPVYVFVCTAFSSVDDKSEPVEYVRYMEALEKPLELLWSDGSRYEAEPRRELRTQPGED